MLDSPRPKSASSSQNRPVTGPRSFHSHRANAPTPSKLSRRLFDELNLASPGPPPSKKPPPMPTRWAQPAIATLPAPSPRLLPPPLPLSPQRPQAPTRRPPSIPSPTELLFDEGLAEKDARLCDLLMARETDSVASKRTKSISRQLAMLNLIVSDLAQTLYSDRLRIDDALQRLSARRPLRSRGETSS